MATSVGLINSVLNVPIEKLGVQRLGMSLSAGTFSIIAANGIALGDGNPAYATLSDKTNVGQLNTYSITTGWDFIDASGSSEIIGNTFGNPTGVATSARNFYIYLVVNDAGTALQAMLSDNPNATLSPAAAAIGAPDDAVADSEGDFWSFDNITEADWESNPCVRIASILMSMDASDDWTVSALTSSVGVDKYPDLDEQWFLVSTTTVTSSAATEDITIPSKYDQILLIGSEIDISGGNTFLVNRFSVDAGSSFSNCYAVRNAAGAVGSFFGVSTVDFYGVNSAGVKRVSILIDNFGATNLPFRMYGFDTGVSGSTVGVINSAKINLVRFALDSANNLNGGTIYLWGR